MGDNATRLAVKLIGSVAQGRGRTLPLDTVRLTICVLYTVLFGAGIH